MTISITLAVLIASLLQAQPIDPVTTERVPRHTTPVKADHGAAIIAQARAENCGTDACPYAFSDPEEIAGSMCWNDDALGEAFCRDAVAGTLVQACHVDTDGALYDCWTHEMMEGALTTGNAGLRQLAYRDITWISLERSDNAHADIAASAYCADPLIGACSRIYNVGAITYQPRSPAACGNPDDEPCPVRLEGWVFEHCWDEADTGLARCHQGLIFTDPEAGRP